MHIFFIYVSLHRQENCLEQEWENDYATNKQNP